MAGTTTTLALTTNDNTDNSLTALTTSLNASMSTLDRQFTQGAAIASAAALALGTDGNYFHVTGTTTITSLTTWNAGRHCVLIFDGALTFTHNATTLILPGLVNILTVAGDRAIMYTEGSGNWRCISYTRANARREWVRGADIASAGTTAIGTDGNFFDITGTTTITAFSGLVNGLVFGTRFAGILVLTHAAGFFLPNAAANITTAANDTAWWVALSTTTVRCISYVKADGTALVAAASGAGTPRAVLNALGSGSTLALSAINDCVFQPLFIPGNMTITKIACQVAVSSGNMSLAIYNSAGTRLGTTGAIATPAAGATWQTITSLALTAGQHFIGLSADSTTATFQIFSGASVFDSGTLVVVGTAHPAPASFTPPTIPGSVTGRGSYLVGVAL